MIYSLRGAAETDLELMMQIGHEGIRPYVEELWGWDQALQEQKFQEQFDLNSISIVLVDGQDVGYIKVEDKIDHIFLAGIYISSQYRSLGIGSAIIRDLINSSKELSKPIRLQVLRTNPSQNLYKRIGFVVTGESESHIFMEISDYSKL